LIRYHAHAALGYSVKRRLSSRVVMSVPPPGEEGTMMRTGFTGTVCAEPVEGIVCANAGAGENQAGNDCGDDGAHR
jgi:hypothetical protein